MIDLKNNVIVLEGKEYPITGHAVWWTIPGVGLIHDLKLAVALCESLDSKTPIYPTPVVTSTDGIYEVLPPEL